MYQDREPIPIDERLVSKIHHPKVEGGTWKTEYHRPIGWRSFEDFPKHLQPLLDRAQEKINFLQRWSPEAFQLNDGLPWGTHFSVVMRGENPPLNIPWFRPPTLDSRRVFGSLCRVDSHPNWHGYGKLLWISECTREFDGGEEIDFRTNFIIKPFVFFDAQTFRIVGEDPFRLRLNVIRAPLQVIRSIQALVTSMEEKLG